MSNTDKYFEDMLESLLYQCVAGGVHYRLWKRLDEALFKFPKLNEEYSTYLRITKEAYYELFFFNLCRLIDTSRRVCNVKKILKYSKEHLEIFKHKKDDISMVTTIRKDVESLEKEEVIIKKILGQRNNYYAHLSKKYLSSFHNDVFEEFSVSSKEMFSLLKIILCILNHLNKNFRAEERILGIYSEKQIECEKQLSILIQKLHSTIG